MQPERPQEIPVLATTVAAYAEILRDSYWSGNFDLDDVAAEAVELSAVIDDADVAEFAELVQRAARIAEG